MKTLQTAEDYWAEFSQEGPVCRTITEANFKAAIRQAQSDAKSSNVTSLEEEKYLLIHEYADNGEHSHYALIERQTGVKVWSEDPEECKAKGYPVNNSSHTADEELDLLVTRIKYASNDKRVKELITAFKNQSVTSLEERIKELQEHRLNDLSKFLNWVEDQTYFFEDKDVTVSQVVNEYVNQNPSLTSLQYNEQKQSKSCPNCLSDDIIVFTSDLDLCQRCGQQF
jgi:hypothetical protein